MSIGRYNKAFVNQFRQDQIVYSFTDDRPYEHISFQQVSGNKQELDTLAKHLTNVIHDVPLINRLIDIMQNGAIPHSTHIAGYIQGVTMLFTDYGNTETYAATYFNSLVLALNDLEELAATFQKDTSEHLLDKLRLPFMNESALDNYLDIDVDTIYKIDNVIEYYMDNFEAYDNYFNSIIRQEEGLEKGVIVSSQVAYYLSQLVLLTDAFIVQLQATREILFEWEEQLNNREYQQLYN